MIKTYPDLVISDNLDEINFSPETVKNYLILLYCQEGKLQVDIDGNTFMVGGENLFICMPQTLISHYMRTPDFKCIVLCVGEHLFDEILSDCFIVEPNWWKIKTYVQENPVAHISDYQYKLLDAYFRLLLVYFEDKQTPYRQRVIRMTAQSVAFEILGPIEQLISEKNEENVKNVIGAKDTIFYRFMEMVNKPGNTEREVRWYADELLISPKYLTSICKEKSGSSASELITKVIVGYIRHYLLKTDMSIKEIAYRMDFPDVSFFCKYVKKHLGTAPLEYRRNNINLE
ncbi:MAG: helix-turn-helix domain-containing protein [Candidatus Aphodosoma sp.]